MKSSRRSRNRVACRRCQRRKIRCDGNLPTCDSCQKADVTCINDGKQEVHRVYMANMENRMRWLESIVRENCPNVDLTRGPDQTILSDPIEVDLVAFPRQEPAQNEERNATPRGHADSEPQQAHEIGLVSLSSGADPRYIGPSSGYFFANRIFSNAGRRSRNAPAEAISGSATLSAELLNTPASLPMRKESAIELSARYFQSIHLVYPFLHEPSHMETIERIYTGGENPSDTFHVFMVLAIAALDLSRQCKVHLPVEGYYTAAMKYANHICGDTSIAGLQGMLLLMVYALHNPSCSLNIWSLNYQCLASLIDLGLQRDVRAAPSFRISVLEQEMRTRVFWVAYTFDRAICTMMGRPIGVRDEACELRFPMDVSDLDLVSPEVDQRVGGPSHMSCSIHLFKLARISSEIKYIMHSISRDTHPYAYPPIKDIYAWQRDMIQILQDWLDKILQNGSDNMVHLCKIKYHEMMILLLRPSPGIPTPSDQSLDLCFHQAVDLLRGFSELYRSGTLSYSRLVVHSIFLSTLVMLHCIWKLPGTAARCQVDELVSDFNISQNILSSIGEYWSEANRARDCIDELSSITIQRLLRNEAGSKSVQMTRRSRVSDQGPSLENQSFPEQHTSQEVSGVNSSQLAPIQATDTGAGCSNLFDDFLQGDFQGWEGISDIDGLMWEFFH